MDLLTILVTTVIVVAAIVLGIFIAYTEFKGIPYRKPNHTSSRNSFQNSEENNVEVLPDILTVLLYEMLHQQESQHHTSETGQPEIPTSHNDDSFWNM